MKNLLEILREILRKFARPKQKAQPKSALQKLGVNTMSHDPFAIARLVCQPRLLGESPKIRNSQKADFLISVLFMQGGLVGLRSEKSLAEH